MAYTATVGGFDYTFDFEDQRIDVDAGLTLLQVDPLWRAIQEAQASPVGIIYPAIATGGGLTVVEGAVKTALTVSLLGNWELNPLVGSGLFRVGGGNLVRTDEQDPFRDNPAITFVNRLSQYATTVAVGSGVTSADITSIVAATVSAIAPQLAKVDDLDVAILGAQDYSDPGVISATRGGRTLQASVTTHPDGYPTARGELLEVP